jgi:ribosomal protein S20
MELKETEWAQKDELFEKDYKSKMKDFVKEREADVKMLSELLDAGH